MTFPKTWTPGELITAQRLNELQRDAARPRRETSLGDGASLVNEALSNQSANMRKQTLRLAVANEDFQIPDTSTDLISSAIDQVPSAPCNMVRLERNTGNYTQETKTLPFRAYDVLAAIGGAQRRSQGDIFYVVYNEDSKRWEVLGADPGTKRIRFTIDEVICSQEEYGEEYHILVNWTHYSGGCGEPPGQEYDGRIAVYDTCLLRTLTAETLLGRSGSATYWYPRSYCNPLWMIDDLCDALECDWEEY